MMPHGTRARYIAGCHCASCRAANTAYGRSYKQARARNGCRLVSTEPVRIHILALHADGVEYVAIARAAGCHIAVLTAIVSCGQQRMFPEVAARIMAVGSGAAAHNSRRPVSDAAEIVALLEARHVTRADMARVMRWRRGALQLRDHHVTRRTYRRLLLIAGHVGAITMERALGRAEA